MPRIDEKEYLLWATPNPKDHLPSRSYEAMKRQATSGARKYRSRPGNVREQVDPDMVQAYKEAQADANGRQFKRKLNPSEKAAGNLNPTWVEWLMGFPIGWTELED
jgi:hypothetical protein